MSLKLAENVLLELREDFKPVLADAHNVVFSNKLNLLLRIVKKAKAAKDKTLVFSHRIPTLDHLAHVLKEAGVSCQRLDGSTNMSKRQELMHSFNESGSHDVFLISTKAGGTGFNLCGANRVVLFDFNFNPTWEEQAIGRAFRLGQKKPVFVYRFISAGTYEEALFNQTIFKLQLASEVVEKKKTKSKAVRMRDYIKMPQRSQKEDFDAQRGSDEILDAILDDMGEAGEELIYGIKLDTIFKEKDDEQLNEEEEREKQQLIQQNQLMNADPEAFRVRQMANPFVPNSTARMPSNPSLSRGASYAGPGPSFTAPFAPLLQPAHHLPSALNIPHGARLPPATNREPHGLPFPGPANFNIGSPNGVTAYAPGGLPSNLINGTGSSPTRGQAQQRGQ